MILSTGPCSLERREQNRVTWEGRSALSYTFEGPSYESWAPRQARPSVFLGRSM